jgi:ABC-2 type transport system permease protein
MILLIIFPIFFLFIFSAAFGGATVNTSSTYDVIFINEDQGIDQDIIDALPPGTIPDSWISGVASDIISLILNTTYPEEDDIYLFEDHIYNGEEFETVLENGAIDLIIEIPEDFSMMMLTLADNIYFNGTGDMDDNATVNFYVDPQNWASGPSEMIARSFFDSYYTAVQSGVIPDSIEIEEQIILRQETFSVFDYIASGLFVFSTILGATYFAASLVVEEEKGTISRLKIALVRPFEFIGAFLLYSFILMMIQFGILFLSAVYLFGFNPVGSLVTAYLIMIITSLATYGLIFICSAYFTNSDTVGNSLGLSSSILGFASGAFSDMPAVILVRDIFSFTSGSPHFLLWDIIPWTHAVNAMRAVLLFDQDLAGVSGDILLLLFSSLLWFVAGIWLYSSRRFRMEV